MAMGQNSRHRDLLTTCCYLLNVHTAGSQSISSPQSCRYQQQTHRVAQSRPGWNYVDQASSKPVISMPLPLPSPKGWDKRHAPLESNNPFLQADSPDICTGSEESSLSSKRTTVSHFSVPIVTALCHTHSTKCKTQTAERPLKWRMHVL